MLDFEDIKILSDILDEKLENKLDILDEKLENKLSDMLDDKLENKLDNKLTQNNSRLQMIFENSTGTQIKAMNEQFDIILDRLTQIYNRMDVAEETMEGMKLRISYHEQEIQKLKKINYHPLHNG